MNDSAIIDDDNDNCYATNGNFHHRLLFTLHYCSIYMIEICGKQMNYSTKSNAALCVPMLFLRIASLDTNHTKSFPYPTFIQNGIDGVHCFSK